MEDQQWMCHRWRRRRGIRIGRRNGDWRSQVRNEALPMNGLSRPRRLPALAILVASVFGGTSVARGADDPPIDKLRLPPGFHVSLYAYPVPGARSMTLGARGTLFVGTQDKGVVYAI